ncbi:hypothetical protein [Lewinella cohaerens]|uniref:hypothetical protein n=1 Tax=Lewinella cohaerens TaxID=70995 RepID=UPI000374D88F|nr:hypothetical protein [Lewinella cohaerens]
MALDYDSIAKYLYSEILEFVSDIEIGYCWCFGDDPVYKYIELRTFETFNKFSDIDSFKVHLNGLSSVIEEKFVKEFIDNKDFVENVPLDFSDRLVEDVKTEIRLIKTDVNKTLLFMDRIIHIRFEQVSSEELELMLMIPYHSVPLKNSYPSLVKSANEYFNLIINTLESLNNKVKMKRLLKQSFSRESMISNPVSGLNQEVKEKIKKEIEETINDPAQKKYKVTLDQAIDLFGEVVQVKLSERGLNDIEGRLYPAISKYFTRNDRHDRLNMVKQMSQSFEPYLKKVLLLVDEEKYYDLLDEPKGKQGLSKVIDLLGRLDTKKNRFKENPRSLPKRDFARELWKVYDTRNREAHSAKDWREKDFQDIFTCHLVVYIYVVLEYSEELFDALK